MKYSNQKNYRDYLKVEIEKPVIDAEISLNDNKNFFVREISKLNKKIVGIFSKNK
jgi:hypothetical protein